MEKYFDTVLGSNGAIIKGGSVSIYPYGSTIIAPLFSDADGTVSKANPLTTDSLGYFEFYAANGRYSMLIAADGYVAKNVADVQQEDPEDLAVYLAAANAAIAVQVASATTQATSASSSASAAAASASTSLASIATVASSATAASNSASTAATQAGLATTNGAAQVALATTQATNSASSASSSATSASASAGSATAASGSASTASTQASNAASSASAASTSATHAATSADTAVAATATKANIDSPTFTGSVSGITAAMVGLGSVNNTSDASKPISSLTATALAGKQASGSYQAAGSYPTGSGTSSGTNTGDQTAASLGLGNVTNTSDASKPVSTAQQTALDLKVGRTSSTGSAQLPTGTQAQRDASPIAGSLRFNSDVNKPEVYNGTSWGSVGGGATGGGSDEVFVQNSQAVTSNYTIPVGKNASAVGPITVPNGVSITVSSGSRWVVL